MNVSLRRATPEDAELLHNMQREAFEPLYRCYRDEISPYLEDIGATRARLEQPFTAYYVICADGEPVGGLRVQDWRDGSDKRLGPIYVAPGRQGRGIAKRAIALAEELHGETGWVLDTIAQEERNCHLYESMGYRRAGDDRAVNERMTLIDYKK